MKKIIILIGSILLIWIIFVFSQSLSRIGGHDSVADYQSEEPISVKLTTSQIKFAAKKIMGNERILKMEPLYLTTGEIKAYEIVFSRKDNIDYFDFKPYIKSFDQFSESLKGQSLNQSYQSLIESEVSDFNASIFRDYFYTLVIAANRNDYPEQFRYKGLPMTFKLKSIANEKLKNIDSRAKITYGQYLYFKIGYISYYFETNSKNKYLLSPNGDIIKLKSLKDVKMEKYYSGYDKRWESKAMTKWSQLLQGFQGDQSKGE